MDKLNSIAKEMLERVEDQAKRGKGRVDMYLTRGLSLTLIYDGQTYTLAIGRKGVAPADAERHIVFKAFGIPEHLISKWRPTEANGWFRIWYQWQSEYKTKRLQGLAMTDKREEYYSNE